MDLSSCHGYDTAITAVLKAQSARMRYLTNLERYVTGTQYVGRADFFSTDCPLWERAPCIIYPIAKTAIDSNVDLILGDDRFPTIAVPHGDDALEDLGLQADEAEIVNRWILEFANYARLKPVARELLYSAQGCGSTCAIVGLRGGRLVVDTTKAAWCDPTLDADGAVTKLVIEYPYLAEAKNPDGTWRVEAMLYRRIIDDTRDVTYKPVKLEGAHTWSVAVSVEHGLGFCPVIWYAHQKGCSTVAAVDGHAIHEYLLDEITALDFTLSQRHRAALYAGDPQWTEVGVEPGTNPSGGGGRMSAMAPAATLTGGPISADNPIVGRYGALQRSNVRKKSPGDVWTYESPEARVTLHTLPGDALTSLDNHAKDLKNKLCEAMGVVFLNPEDIPRGGELSGRAVAALKARQLDRCDSTKADFGDLCLRPLITMLFRIIVERPEGLKIPGIKKVKSYLMTLLDRGLLLHLEWGPYIRPEPAEELARVQSAQMALEAGVATKRSAVVMLKDILKVDDVDAHVELLEEAQKEQEAKDAKAMAAGESGKGIGGAGGGAGKTLVKPYYKSSPGKKTS